MARLRRDALRAGILFFASATLYLSLLSKSYVFEGLARAMPIELDRFRNLFNGNYLLYGLLGWCFHRLLALVHEPMAVTSLQILDALVGAAGVALFFRLLRKLDFEAGQAALGACVLGATLGYLRWSTDAEDYIVSTFLLLLNFYVLVDWDRAKRRPALLGALQALAVTGHIVNVAFAPVALWMIAERDPKRRRRALLEYAAAALVCVLAAYAVALFIVQPGNAGDALRWFWGSANRAAGVSFGGGYSPGKLWLWLRSTVNVVTSLSPAFEQPPGWSFAPALLWGSWALIVLLLASLLAGWRRLSSSERRVAAGCAIWIACYAAVFASWQPDTLVYRTTDLPPICLLLALAARRLGAAGLGLSAALAATLFAGNLGAEILPRSYAANNPDLARMDFVREHTSDNDWITGGGGKDELYLPFFARRKPLVIDRFRSKPDELFAFAKDAQARGEAVLVTSRTLDDPFWRERLAGRLVPASSDGSGFTLYRLKATR